MQKNIAYKELDKCPNCGVNLYAIPGMEGPHTPLQALVAEAEEPKRNGKPVKGYPLKMPCNVPGCPFETAEEQKGAQHFDVLTDAFSDGTNYG